MNGKQRDYLIKGSVRSLPKGKMQDIRKMFDHMDVTGSTPPVKETPKSYVQATGAKFDTKNGTSHNDTSPAPKWRQHISEPKNARSQSPVTSGNVTSPPPAYSNYPVPSPRKTVENKEPVKTNQSQEVSYLSKLPLQKFGDIASSVVRSDSQASQVNKVIGRFENKNTDIVSDPAPLKTPLRPRNASPRSKSPSPSRSEQSASPKKSPLLVRRPHEQSQNRDENHVYSCIWEGSNSKKAASYDTDRPASVFERSKIFGNVKQTGNTHGVPSRPPPPGRQKSLTEETVTLETPNSGKKNLPPRPPYRQRSVSEKANPFDANAEDKTANGLQQMRGRPGPVPPSKPRRTGAHDDYIKVKFEKEAAENRVKSEEINNGIQGDSKVLNESPAECDTEQDKFNKDNQKNKPRRPPPPRLQKKPRPFSIATDSFMDFQASEESDFENSSEHKIPDNPFYETVTLDNEKERPLTLESSLQHWDLPLSSHQEPVPLRRSLSAECVQKAVDNEGKASEPVFSYPNVSWCYIF